MACDDCQSVTQKLKKVSASADYHTSGDNCCFKNVCEKYCSYKCSNCLFTNKIDIEDSFDNFYDAFICSTCSTVNNVKVVFYGDIKEACRRYCQCGLHEKDDFYVRGLEPTSKNKIIKSNFN